MLYCKATPKTRNTYSYHGYFTYCFKLKKFEIVPQYWYKIFTLFIVLIIAVYKRQ